MDRRKFLGAAMVGVAGASMAAAQQTEADSPVESVGRNGHGACGLSCEACRMRLNGKCPGCGEGTKANCAILRCTQEKELTYCAECPGLPCPKIENSGKFGEPWLEKLRNAPVPA